MIYGDNEPRHFAAQGCRSLAQRPSRGIIWIGLAFIAWGWATPSWGQDGLRFVEHVQFVPASALTQIAGVTGSLLTTTPDATVFRMRLTDVAIGGAGKNQDLYTEVLRKDLSLKSHSLMDVVAGKPIRQMLRKTGDSVFDNKQAEVFQFREYKDNNVTQTEPYVEFKVADFLSVMLIAADAINSNNQKPIELSMLRDRSVTRARLTFEGPTTAGRHQGTKVRVASPDTPEIGIIYVMGKTKEGRYFPVLISVPTPQGAADLEGVPQ